MKFEIHALNTSSSTSNQETWFFDNLLCEIYAPNGERVRYEETGLAEEWRRRSEQDPIKRASSEKKYIRTLRLSLGLNCNRHCSYCLQAPYRQVIAPFPDKDRIVRFFKAFDNAGYELSPSGKIAIWGGEPLVYWKALLILIPMLRDKFGQGIRIRFHTNGLLMTAEKAEFLAKHRIEVLISHDAQGNSLREDIDPLLSDSHIRSSWLRLHELTAGTNYAMRFNTVLTPRNADILKIREFFTVHFAETVLFDISGIVSYEAASFPEGTFKPIERSLLSSGIFHALLWEADRWPSLAVLRDGVMKPIVCHQPLYSSTARCKPRSDDALTVGIDGRILFCHNRPEVIGNLTDKDNGRSAETLIPVLHSWNDRPSCRSCPVVAFCRGACPILSEDVRRRACSNEALFYLSIFRAAWFSLTGTVMMSIRPHTKQKNQSFPVLPILRG